MKKNKDSLLIVGAGGLGRMTMESALDKYNCFFVDDNIEINTKICDCSVVGKIEDLKKLYKLYKNVVIAIGDNKLREKITFEAIRIGYDLPTIINKTAYVSNYCTISDGCIILSNASIQNGAKLGKGVVITANVEVHHDCEIDDYSLVYSNSTIRTNAYVGKRVKIGSNVTVGNEIKISNDEEIKNGETK